MKLVCNGYEEERKTARFKGWDHATGDFCIYANGRLLVSCFQSDALRYEVSFIGVPPRIIEKRDIQPTVRLYCDAQRLRKTIGTARTMTIRPCGNPQNT